MDAVLLKDAHMQAVGTDRDAYITRAVAQAYLDMGRDPSLNDFYARYQRNRQVCQCQYVCQHVSK